MCPRPASLGRFPRRAFSRAGQPEGAVQKRGFDTPPCFTSFVAETRSSQEPSATLEDLSLGTLDSCGSIELKKTWVGPKSNTTINIGTTAGGSQIDTATANGVDADTGPNQVAANTYHSAKRPLATPVPSARLVQHLARLRQHQE